MSTYEAFQNQEVSEKTGLVTIDPAKRLMGWVVSSGSIYFISSDTAKILSIEEDGTALTEVSSLAAVVPGTYFNDRTAKRIYLETTGSANPNSLFIAMVFRLYFSNSGVIAPNDPSDATSFEVEWLPLLDSISDFGVELDNRNPNQIGVAVEGKGSIKLKNDQSYWASRYDKLTWENKRVQVWSWNRLIPITEAKTIYKGIIERKEWSQSSVSFGLKDLIAELKGEPTIPTIAALSTERVPDDLKPARQRRLYGFVNGYRPTNIDQVFDAEDEGYPLTGTVSTTVGVATVTGVGTSFLKELSPDDDIKFVTADEDSDTFTVGSVQSDTSLTLSQPYDGTANLSGAVFFVIPSHPKRYINRKYVLAHHALRQPETVVSGVTNLSTFRVSDITDFRVGDEIFIGTEKSTIQRLSGDRIKLTTNLVATPAAGTAVIRPAVNQVRIGRNLLLKDRDYTIDPSSNPSTLTLDELAEFNVGSIRSLVGTSVTFNGTRAVTGVGTSFTAQLKPGDWLRVAGNVAFFEILSIESDTSLTLRVAASYSDTDVGEYKAPEVVDEDNDLIVSCDVLGKTEDGLKSGTFINTAAAIAKDLLTEAGLGSDLETTSFDDAAVIAPQRVGIAIPDAYDGQNIKNFRDLTNDLGKSVFGALYQSPDFQLKYTILSPKKPADLPILDEDDVIGFSIKSLSDRIVKSAVVNYDFRELNAFVQGPSNRSESKTSDIGQYLTKTENVRTVDTVLVDQGDAVIMVSRWAFLLELASTVIKVNTKLQGARLAITDAVEFNHSRSFERFGSNSPRRIGAVQSLRKDFSASKMELEDLNGAFVRVANITDSLADIFADAQDVDKVRNGYITDSFGLISNNENTAGINLIW